MIIEPIEFCLRDGRKAVLRSPCEADVMPMLEYLRVSSGETDFLLRYPEECGKYTPEGEKALFESVNASEDRAMIVCEVAGELAGNCMISFYTGIKTRHRANVAIALLRKYWGQGIGSRMFEEMISIAESNPEILQMELEFIEGNSRARALYEKFGFRIVAVHPDAVRLKDGTLCNEYLMIRKMRQA